MTSVGESITFEAKKPSVSILAFSVPIVRIYAFMHRPDLPRKDGRGGGGVGDGGRG